MSIASEIDRINGEVSSQSTIIDEISTILDGKSGINLNSIDYSSNVYSTTSISYYNKSGGYVTKNIENIGGANLDDVDFTKQITFDLGSQGEQLGIKLVNGILVADVYGGTTP